MNLSPQTKTTMGRLVRAVIVHSRAVPFLPSQRRQMLEQPAPANPNQFPHSPVLLPLLLRTRGEQGRGIRAGFLGKSSQEDAYA